MQWHTAEPQRRDVHARARRQPELPRVAPREMAKQVDAGVARAYHEHIQASHLPDVAELPGVDHHAGEGSHPGPAGHDRLSVRPGGEHRVRGPDAALARRQHPATIRLVDPVNVRAQPQPRPCCIILQVGHIVIASRKRPAAARDTRTRLMREHPVSVQAKIDHGVSAMTRLPNLPARPRADQYQPGASPRQPPDRPGQRQ
jgi:hypothetical protein